MAWDFKKRSRAIFFETVEHYLERHGHMTVEKKEYPIDDSWPCYPKGNQMPRQPFGCYKIPGHPV